MSMWLLHVMTLPNLLTITRILLTPWVFWAIVAEAWGTALTLLVVCSLTDFLDGFIARMYQQQTFVGTCLDPIADKLFVIISFYALFIASPPGVVIPRWFIGFIVVKEMLLVVGALSFCFSPKRHRAIRPSLYGKVAAGIQMSGLCVLLTAAYGQYTLGSVAEYFFVVLAVIMMIALLDYCFKAISAYKKGAV